MRIPLPALVSLLLVSLLVNIYILWDIRSYTRKTLLKVSSVLYGTFACLCMGLVIAIACIPLRDEQTNVLGAMWILFSYLTVLIPQILYTICSALGRLFSPKDHRKVNYGVMAGIPLGLIAFIAMWWGVLFTRHEIDIRKVEIVSPRLPKKFDDFKVVQLSDLHVGTWANDTTFVSALVDSVNNLKPDLVLFTGDIVNRRTEELEPFIPVLRRLNARYGVYSVLGNHDYGDYVDWGSEKDKEANNQKLADYQRDMGWELLNNDSRWIHQGADSIALIGVENWGDPPFKQYGDLKSSYVIAGEANEEDGEKMDENSKVVNKFRALNDSNFKILLTHNPEHWRMEVEPQTNIDLTLSGHTHAMQNMIRVGDWKWSPAMWRYKLWGGLYSNERKNAEKSAQRSLSKTSKESFTPEYLYVNIGSGEVGIPTRIGAVPEITLITLKHGNSYSTTPKAERFIK